MSATVNVNGLITGERDAVISVFDHGFLYGEGIYEVMRTYNGRIFLYDRHLRRMRNSARMIVLDVPFTDEQLAESIRETMAASALSGAEAYIRVLVTRGVGDLTYDPMATPIPSIVIIVKPQIDPPPEAYEQGVRATIVETTTGPHGIAAQVEVEWPDPEEARPDRISFSQVYVVTDGLVTEIHGHDDKYSAITAISD